MSGWVDSQPVHEQDIRKVHTARRVRALAAYVLAQNDLTVHRFGQISGKTCLLERTNHLAVNNLENGTGGDREIAAGRIGGVSTHHAIDNIAFTHLFKQLVPGVCGFTRGQEQPVHPVEVAIDAHLNWLNPWKMRFQCGLLRPVERRPELTRACWSSDRFSPGFAAAWNTSASLEPEAMPLEQTIIVNREGRIDDLLIQAFRPEGFLSNHLFPGHRRWNNHRRAVRNLRL